MADTLEIFGVEYTNVTGIIAKDDNGTDLTFTRGGGSPTLQTKTKTYTPTTSQQTESVSADSGYDGLSAVNVTVNAMPTGTAGTPTATKGTVSNHQVAVTPSVTNTTGYITGSTKTGTAVTVTASELASGNKAITENGTNIDVVGYSTVSVAVPSGGGEDIPIFTITDGVATCNKSYSEMRGNYEAIIAKIYVDGQLASTSAGGFYQSTSSSLVYIMFDSGVPVASITYNSNGTIELDEPAPSVETLTVTSNDTYDADYNKVWNKVIVNVPSGSSKNTQVVQGTTRTTSSTLTAIGAEMTVTKTGTYDVYWSAFRSSTSSSYTYGTQLYVDGTAYRTQNTTWSNHVQNNHLTGVSLTANQKIRVYGRNSRGSSYYIYAPTLVIVEA